MTDLPPRSGDDAADALLLERARAGDGEAFASLYGQEVDAARRLARILVGEEQAEELVAESFARVLTQLKAGRGPTEDFRAYLHVTIRNRFRDGLRAPKESPSSDQPWLLDDVLPPVEELVEDLDREVAVAALATLPTSWQQVLWHLEVEGRKPAEVAGILDMEAGAVSSLAYRAREGLKRAYLDQHLQPVSGGSCGWTQSRMSQYVRGDLSARAAAKVGAHVDACSACGAALLTVDRVNQRLAAWLFPVVLWGVAEAKKGGLLWFAGASGAGAGGAAGTSASGGGSGPSPNPLVLGVAGAVAACAIAGGVALAVTAGGDEPPPSRDTGATAGAGGAGDPAPPAPSAKPSTDESTNRPPADRSTGPASAPPPATTSAAPTHADPTPSETAATTTTTATTRSATTTSTSTSTATATPAPATGGLVSVVVSQVESARAVAGRQRAAVVNPYAVTVISAVTGDVDAMIEVSYTFDDARVVNVMNPPTDGWSCGGVLDLLVPAGQPVTCTFRFVGTSPPPVALEVTNVLQPNQPEGTVTMTIDGAPADPGELDF